MNTKTFRIVYRDPDTLENVTVIKTFPDDDTKLPAKDWADDFAYARADKGPYTITEVAPE